MDFWLRHPAEFALLSTRPHPSSVDIPKETTIADDDDDDEDDDFSSSPEMRSESLTPSSSMNTFPTLLSFFSIAIHHHRHPLYREGLGGRRKILQSIRIVLFNSIRIYFTVNRHE